MVTVHSILRRIKTASRLLGWTLSYDAFLSAMSVDPNPDYLKLFDAAGVALVHIPKTGGTSLSYALYGKGVWHRRWDQIRDADPAGFERWHKVAVVRDPVDRFVSAFGYLRSGGANEFDRFISMRFVNCDLDRFVERVSTSTVPHPVLRYWHFLPQADFVTSHEGVAMVDQLIAFERLADGARSLGIAHLPQLNVSRGHRYATAGMSNETRSRIRSIYPRDVALYETVARGG